MTSALVLLSVLLLAALVVAGMLGLRNRSAQLQAEMLQRPRSGGAYDPERDPYRGRVAPAVADDDGGGPASAGGDPYAVTSGSGSDPYAAPSGGALGADPYQPHARDRS